MDDPITRLTQHAADIEAVVSSLQGAEVELALAKERVELLTEELAQEQRTNENSQGIIDRVIGERNAALGTIDALNEQIRELTGEIARLKAENLPPAPTGPVYRAHEPAGYITLADRGFESIGDPLDKYNAEKAQFWDSVESRSVATDHTKSGIFLITDPTAPISPPSVLCFHHAQGTPGGSAVGTLQVGGGKWPKNITEWHAGWAFRYSENWMGHPARTNKHNYFWLDVATGPGPQIVPRVRGAGDLPLTFNIGLQGMADPREEVARFGDTGINPNVGDGTVKRGQWHEVETHFKLNDDGVPNGVIEAWLNGKQIISISDWMPRNGMVQKPGGKLIDTRFFGLWQWQWTPVYGGGGNIVPVDQDLMVDHVYLTRAP